MPLPAGEAVPTLPNLADIRPVDDDGQSTTYQATDLRLQRPVSLKVFAPLTDEAERAQFDSDAKQLGRLSAHPNVATVYDAGFIEGDRPYLVSESVVPDPADPDSVGGPTLADRLAAAGPLPWQDAVDVVLQLCAGLEQAHRAGVLHRELCPATVTMAGPTPKLTNFKTSADRPSPTAGLPTGPTLAALLHSAPETLGRPSPPVWDERTDLYSLGSILHEMIDGQAPFWRPGDHSAEAIHLRLTHEKPPALEPELVPPALAVFIAAALSKDPIDRPQSAAEFAHELRLIREGRITGSTPSVLHGTTGSLPVVNPATAFGQADSETGGGPPQVSTATTIEPGAPPSGAGRPGPGAFAAGVISELGSTSPPPPPVHNRASDVNPAWPPPVDGVTADGNTAVYADFMRPPGDGVQAGHDHNQEHDLEAELIDFDQDADAKPPRSNTFMAAVAMIALGIVGLGAVLTISALRPGNAEDAAPVLPDPNGPATVIGVGAEADGSALVGQSAEGDAMEDGAMEEGAVPTTSAPAEQMNTTETTVARVTVPNMIGLNVEAATKQLSDAGFEVLIIGRQSTSATPGTVTQQKPDAGAMVALPLTVTLYIPRVSNLPTMVGRSADAVCLELQALSLTCARVLQFSDTVPIGSVIASNPAAGALFREGSTVELTVSRGPVMNVRIPSVTGLNRVQAEESLKAAGFILVSFQEASSENVDAGLAIGSSPGATTLHPNDQMVVVSLSTGPPAKARVPNVVGLDQAAAETQLQGLGFTVTVEMTGLPVGDSNIGKVTAMNPPADSDVTMGGAVTITVGQEMMESTTTTAPASTTTSTSSSTTATTESTAETTSSSTTTTTAG